MAAEEQWWRFDSENESLDECNDRRLRQMPVLSPAECEVLRQCMHPVWDGNVASKSARDSLFRKGIIVRFNGWQIVSEQGLAMLRILGYLDDRDIWVRQRR